jgi:hypothetical protein
VPLEHCQLHNNKTEIKPMKTVFAIAISMLPLYAFAGSGGQINTLQNVVTVTEANSGQNNAQDKNREELSVAVVDANGPVADAKCTLSNDKGDWSVAAPDKVTVRRSRSDLKIECAKAGYDTATGVVKASTTQITPKRFAFGTDAGGDGEEDAEITVPQYGPTITITLNAKAAAQQTAN